MRNFIFFLLMVIGACNTKHEASIVVQTDFGEKDGAVAAMKGVANNVFSTIKIYDLTHEIPAYNIWEAAYRLHQVFPYWPEGTVFVSVVDPGVGTERASVVAKTKSGKYIVTPDNGTLTLIDDIEVIRSIDESVNRREGSFSSHTFHGRDVYMYTAARLASGKINFDEVGPVISRPPVKIPYQVADSSNGVITGNIPVLDIQYGNVWTNIPESLIMQSGFKVSDTIYIQIFKKDSLVTKVSAPFVNSFGAVSTGENLCYINSLGNFAIAINMGNFSQQYQVFSGSEWTVRISGQAN